ncbi:alpha/beta fold hydrolase [Mycolicibacterium sp. P1-18]|uniref:alpha/beta fold hydrolase n=1 Tax=Mycolicibacterium sp. P1-18 TaxID=2024615 RepID=UPI0011F2B44E|nr:alpha/beta fold hydrolase [Mycolicibacterium sp. P1-18]KAA0092649.1 alpha/beta fold hydrolase [Mycolicibacterium sp. P1-18]
MTAPTLVLLHGVGLDHHMWEPVVERLPDTLRVLAPDLPGHGTKPPVADGATLADLAGAVARDIPAGSHVLGFSLGALIAQHLAVHRSDLVASLISVSSVCRRTPVERDAVLARLAAAESDFGASVEASIHRWYDGTGVDAERIVRTRNTLLANDRRSFVNCYRVFATGDADVAPHLGDVVAPSLAVTGELDPGSTPEMTHRLAAAIPDCKAVVVPHARHMLPVEYPGELAELVSSFVERLTRV